MTDAPFPLLSWVSEPSKTPPRRKEIPVALQAEPEVRRHAKDPSRSQDRIGRYRSALDDLVEPGERRRRSAEFLLVCETRLVLFLPGSNSPFVESFQGGVCEFADLRLTDALVEDHELPRERNCVAFDVHCLLSRVARTGASKASLVSPFSRTSSRH